MAALDYLRCAGLAVELEGSWLCVILADRLTDAHRQYLRDHWAELIEANDSHAATEPRQAEKAPLLMSTQCPAKEGVPEASSEPKRNSWTIIRGGGRSVRSTTLPCLTTKLWPKPFGAGLTPTL